jgi:hypothetical protein
MLKSELKLVLMEAQPVTASRARKIVAKMADYHTNGTDLTFVCYLQAALMLPDSDLLTIFPKVIAINSQYSEENIRKLGDALNRLV